MKVYSEVCPICGTLNEHLYLEETEGFFECQRCESYVKSVVYDTQYKKIPLFDLAKPKDHQRIIEFLGNKAKSIGII